MPDDSNLHNDHHQTSSPTQQNSLQSVELGIQCTTHINSILQTTSTPFSKPLVTPTRESLQHPGSMRKTKPMSREYWTGNVTRLITVTFSEQTELPGSSKVMDSHHLQTTEQNDDPPQANQEHKGITISRSPPPVAYTGQTRSHITATMFKNQQSVVDTHSTKIKHANQFRKTEALANNTSYSQSSARPAK